ncbi:50S ribosomal protein L35 [Verrucomicrobia bacterium]|nr:50S ribosomal protein L35 [Verrucomicrobiota bacterium]
MRRARSQKTRKAAAKRFKITASGKILRSRQGRRHLAACKNAKRKRRLGTRALVSDADTYRVLSALPFSR